MFSDKQRSGLIWIVVFIIVAAFGFHLYDRLSPPPSGVIVKSEDEKPSLKEIYVYVHGAVKNPGVYKVYKGSRVFEVIELAGGLSPSADVRSINLARVVEDGENISVPTIEGTKVQTPSVGEEAQAGRREKLINVNKASVEELEKLPGIGKTIAQRIVNYREKNGPFKSPSDLLKVKGIGEKKLEKIKGLITF